MNKYTYIIYVCMYIATVFLRICSYNCWSSLFVLVVVLLHHSISKPLERTYVCYICVYSICLKIHAGARILASYRHRHRHRHRNSFIHLLFIHVQFELYYVECDICRVPLRWPPTGYNRYLPGYQQPNGPSLRCD